MIEVSTGDPVAAPLRMIDHGPVRGSATSIEEEAAGNYFAGLDVSLEKTAVCVVDETGRIVREARVASEPEGLSSLVHWAI